MLLSPAECKSSRQAKKLKENVLIAGAAIIDFNAENLTVKLVFGREQMVMPAAHFKKISEWFNTAQEVESSS